MDKIRKAILNHYEDHTASSFSCVEILDALYGVTGPPILREEDTFILSKGHAAPALYTILAMKGVLKWDDLPKYGLHCDHKAPGIPFTTGSLGCGLGLGGGVALAKRLKGESGRVYVLCGDGEWSEGSMQESFAFADRLNLWNDKLTLIIDHNERCTYEKVSIPFQGLDVGHDLPQMRNYLLSSPICIVRTTKGKGLPPLEKDPLSHIRKVREGKVM